MLSVLLALTAALCLLLAFRPDFGLSAAGRSFAFIAIVVLPLTAAFIGVGQHIEAAKQTSFCLSCHVMSLHGKSLRVDDDSLLVASHFQGGRIPRETACYSCHTNYTMFGDLNSKLRGLRHVWINYVKGPPKETAIRLYEPYNNRECLHCHGGTRRFEGGRVHRIEAGRMEKIRNNLMSCIAKGCHDVVHEAAHLDGLDDWRPPSDALPAGGAP